MMRETVALYEFCAPSSTSHSVQKLTNRNTREMLIKSQSQI